MSRRRFELREVIIAIRRVVVPMNTAAEVIVIELGVVLPTFNLEVFVLGFFDLRDADRQTVEHAMIRHRNHIARLQMHCLKPRLE